MLSHIEIICQSPSLGHTHDLLLFLRMDQISHRTLEVFIASSDFDFNSGCVLTLSKFTTCLYELKIPKWILPLLLDKENLFLGLFGHLVSGVTASLRLCKPRLILHCQPVKTTIQVITSLSTLGASSIGLFPFVLYNLRRVFVIYYSQLLYVTPWN